jgi:uncharacterized protein (TIGR02996 family)
VSATRNALEAALADNPDDLAAHAAYADLLTEEGDPRGEYIRLQLAQEDRDQPPDRLRAMATEAKAIRDRHERDWLGPLAPFTEPARRGASVGAMVAEGNVVVGFRRGWVDRVEVHRLTDEVRDAIAAAPICRLLAELVVWANGESTPARRDRIATVRYVSLTPLAESPNVANLRRLELGDESAWHQASFHDDVAALVQRTPRLEHLQIAAERFVPDHVFDARLPNLRTLHVTTNNNRLPVAILGRNDSLRNLTRLHLDLVAFVPEPDVEERRDPVYPDELRTLFTSRDLTSLEYLALRLPGFGDAGVDELIASGLIGRLKGLDLCRCMITDDGARALAACPHVPNLEYLHLDNNYLTPAGIDALAAVGVQVSEQQFFAVEWDPDDPDAPLRGEDIPF